jgi:rare lipoprotein A
VKEEIKVVENESTTHIATWYNLHGNKTASGERFHKDSLTAAYNFVKLGTYLKVTNISNEESVIVKVTDRMGNKTANRIDLSISAFDSIANLSSGKAKVLIEVIK